MAEEKKTSDTIFKIGSKGDEVGKIQTALGDYYTKFGAKVDNDYGNDTAGGVWDWQTQWNKDNPNDQIKVDGIVGPQTYPRLMQWAAAKSAPTVTTPTTGQPQQAVTTPAADAGGTTTTPATTEAPVTNAIMDAQVAKMNEVIDPVTGKPKNITPATEEQQEKYLADWANTKNVYEEAKRLNVPILQVLQDYWKWGHDTGNPTNWIEGWFQDMDLRKSVAENEEEKKKQERKERWDKVNNFLLHLGNVIGNVGSGGYGSVKLEDPVQWTERQRLLKDKALEQRRLNTQSILQQMHREDEKRREYDLARMKNENEKRKLDRLDQDQRLKNRKQDWLEKYQQGILDDKAERRRIEEEYKHNKITLDERNTAVGELNAMTKAFEAHNPVNSTTTYEKDSRGKVTASHTTSTRGNGNSSGNTPPSRNRQQNSQNTPPSRRR